ncbi:MAG TPA: Spy/CpxP family protein refolding chaperone [Terriglobales bacterium]|nr:Spy/CpxP family protein refolding chaperone [Terriglobales bacterium]
MKLGPINVTSAVLTLALLTGVAAAQGPRGRGGDFFGPMLGRMSDVLDLTDAQQAQIKQIFQNGKSTMKPLWEQERQSHEAMRQLITSGKFDQATAQNIANQEALIHAQIEVQHAALSARAYEVLTADQKTKLAQVIAKHQLQMQERMQQHSQLAPQ